jgi:hypothetical protein
MPYAQHLQIVPIDKEAVEAKLSEVANTPRLPQEIDISVCLENASLKKAEIDILTIGKPSEFKVWQLPTVNPYFIPRPKLTDELKAKLPQKKAGEESAKLLLTAATGMGGIGKTELARHFITYKELSDHYQRRFWLTATTESQLRNEFMQLAIYLGLVEAKKYIEDKELINLIHRWLSINPGWLMILDNADDYNDIASWIPKEGGAVLVTTREPTPGTMRPDQIIPVPLLEQEEAVTWLYQLSKRNKDSLSEQEKAAAKQLVDDLGYLPLAIAQAAAYLREQSHIYIAEYQTRFITLLSDPTLASQDESKSDKTQNDPDKKSRKVVASTWMLSLQAIEAYVASHNMPNIAQELLSFCVYFAPKNIPLLLLDCLLRKFYQVESNLVSFTVDEYVGQLVRYSLLERSNIVSLISIHRLLQQIIRDQLTKKDKNPYYLFKGLMALNYIYPHSKDLMVEYALTRVLKSHLEEILKYLDNYLNQLNVLNNENAKQLVSNLQKIALLPLLMFLTDAYGALGCAKEQKILLERALKIQEAYYGKEHVVVARTLVNLGNAYGDLGNVREKKILLKRALKIQEAHYGKEHVVVASTLNDLANAYGDLGNDREKKILLERALNIKEAHFGKEHVEIARTLGNLGNAYGALGDTKEQKVLLERALKIFEETYGKEHVVVARTLGNLGCVYGYLGDVNEKKILLERALKIEEAYYGKEHVEVAMTVSNLANAYGDLGDLYVQKEMLERSLKVFEAYYGKEHVEVAKTLDFLANAYGALEDTKEQKVLLERSLKIKEAYYGKEHSELGKTLFSLGKIYFKQNSLVNAEVFLQRAYGILLKSHNFGEKHQLTKDVKQILSLINTMIQLTIPENKSNYSGNFFGRMFNTSAPAQSMNSPKKLLQGQHDIHSHSFDNFYILNKPIDETQILNRLNEIVYTNHTKIFGKYCSKSITSNMAKRSQA